ncbi:MAG: hypothetical protein FD147_1070 [Chloroflexi bacterium]|nr:MAG: hypothetical protein FD147_1070 [Chloroflexota bacterium]MBA4375139.1 DUF951 domain-containing protein [Anaerolinea sp.]
MLLDLNLGDVVRMRKVHPCGGFEWKVVRLGADIGLVCLTCQHRIMLSRRDLEHKMKALVPNKQMEKHQDQLNNEGA